MSSAEHHFGGAWTEQKLALVSYYSEFFTAALKGRADASYRFDLWYIDAFAGSGERTETIETGGVFEGTPVELAKVQLDGSAKRAMAVNPPFKHLVFIEDDGPRFNALCALQQTDPRVTCIKGDANEILPELFQSSAWRIAPGRSGKGMQRGIVFLDPYGMQVRWETLAMLAATRRVDVWFLFPIEAVSRQLAHRFTAVDSWKQASLDAVFGGPEWRNDIYCDAPSDDLFATAAPDKSRAMSRREIEGYFTKRLEGLFSYVSPPMSLGNRNQFSLFLLVANDSPAAVALAKSAMKDVLKRHALAASRRTSGL